VSTSQQKQANPQLILITELITAGSIREYLKKIRLPRLIVIKNWCFKILQGLDFLHNNDLVHGKLTCESIYINSNNGDIKIGDVGQRDIPLFNLKKSEIHMSTVLKNEAKTNKYDVYCFGLCLLEMITSDIKVPHTFKYLCKLINLGFKDKIINLIEDA
jgi:WNK lysine deficient protein kinase